MTSLEHLLPAPDQSVRCADHSRGLAVDPGGTAIRADRVILIETPLPWPKPVFDHPVLREINPILKRSSIPTRTLACVPDQAPDDPAASPAVPTVITFDRTLGSTGLPSSTEVVERRFELQSQEDLRRLATALAENRSDEIDGMACSIEPLASQVLLVCTQGSHDVCCGSEGARFAAEADTIAELTVYRVSHTGGHRFAPTAMTLPDGRMWSDLDMDLLRQVLHRTGDTAEVADRCRGWWGADTGPAQIAERAAFVAAGWELEDQPRSITVEPATASQAVAADGGDGATTCTVATDDRSWSVTVAAGRTVPTIACRQPGGLPAKPSTEYQVQRVVER